MDELKEGIVLKEEDITEENGWLEQKPFPNEHSARLKAPGAYKRFRRENNKFGSGIHAIWGVRKDSSKVELQAIRFDKSKFTVAQAKAWLKDHDHKPISFEPASGGEASVTELPDGPLTYKAFPFELKEDADVGEGMFEGYGAAFGNRDLQDDIIVAGAFAETVKRHVGRGPTVKMLWQHDEKQPIGTWPTFEEDDKGLHVIGKLELEVQRAREAYVLMRAKALDGLSVGFNTKKYERDEITGVRRLLLLDTWETSPVTFPANPKARVRRVKDTSVRDVEEILRDAGFSRREAKAIVSDGWRSLTQRDADVQALDALAKGIEEVRKALKG